MRFSKKNFEQKTKTKAKTKSAILGCALMSLFAVSLTGCDEEFVPVDTTTDTITSTTTTGSDTTDKTPQLSQTLDVKDEGFKLICQYDTGTYDVNSWHVTEPKSISMTVKTKDLPEGYEVYIDHVHADISLKSTSPQLNGINQDSMDDTFHGQSQDGFFINNDEEYYNIFSIEGYTDQFYQLWGSAFGNYGSISSQYQKLTEGNIVKSGCYAEKLSIVYDISIKKTGTDKLCTKSVISEMLIPISKTITYKDSNGNVSTTDLSKN